MRVSQAINCIYDYHRMNSKKNTIEAMSLYLPGSLVNSVTESFSEPRIQERDMVMKSIST